MSDKVKCGCEYSRSEGIDSDDCCVTELVEALEDLLESMEWMLNEKADLIVRARAALKKARGEENRK